MDAIADNSQFAADLLSSRWRKLAHPDIHLMTGSKDVARGGAEGDAAPPFR